MTSRRCRAVVFDLDGTLVDSLSDIRAALVAALHDHGLPEPSAERVRDWIGEGARTLVERAVAWAGEPPARTEPVFRRFGEHYRATPVAGTVVYDGVAAALDALAARGYTLAVLSNKPDDLTRIVIDRLLPGRFAHVAGARAGTPLKPDAAAIAPVLAALGIPPSDAAMVGDSAIDVATACNAGALPVAVTWGLRPRAELEAAGAAHLVDHPAELLTLFP